MQHPSRIPDAGAAAPWAIVEAYLNDGLDGANQQINRARRGNSHRNRGRALPVISGTSPLALDRPPKRYAFTIADVAQNGAFPAEGFADRVTAWATATFQAWTSHRGPH